ncbi:uncharacterized protein LOC131928515 [Physella acuta]|uniref:uncharacterized protein LOC131928515 n=1 Tax=Physella acuta TaxID=109671 RepID=UPI0027DC72CA|nr:uncharacterized protein LOC131928515 [Physella acuta]
MGDNKEEIKFCCSELPSPCTAALEVAETLVKGDSCVVYNLTEAGVRNTVNLTLRFDVCGSEVRSNTYVIALQQKEDGSELTSATAQVTWTRVTDYVDLISADRSSVLNTTEIAVNTTRYVTDMWIDDQKNNFIVGLSVTTATFVLLFLITTVAYCCRVRLRLGVYDRRNVSNTAKISEFGDKCLPLRPLNPPDDEVNIYDVIPDDFGYQNQPPDLSVEENFRELSETARESLTYLSTRRSGGYPPAPWPCGAQAPPRHTPLELQIDEYLIPIDLQSDPPSAAITDVYNPHSIVDEHDPLSSTNMAEDASIQHYSKVIVHTGEVQRSKGQGDTGESVDSENGYITPIDVTVPLFID